MNGLDHASLPVVDLSDEKNALHVLRNACEKFGFFYLTNHGIKESLIEEVSK